MGLFEFKLPDIGEGMHEGEVVKWHIKPGDSVEEDQVIVEIQNDKAVVELPSPVNGKVQDVKVPEGSVTTVGTVIVTFEVEGAGNASAGDQATAPAEPAKPEPVAQTTQTTTTAPPQQSAETASATTATTDKVLATPSVRRYAREQGVDPSRIQGTGRHGQVTKADIEAFIQNPTDAHPAKVATESVEAAEAPMVAEQLTGLRAEERVPLKGIRKVIAGAMVKSVYTAPHVTIMDEVDVTALVEFRAKMKPLAEQKGVKLTYLPFIVKALVAAARQFPVLNASIDDDRSEIIYKKYFNIGIATDTDNGLIVPVIEDADRRNIWNIAEQIKDLATRGREGKLALNEMKGSTITITNIGSAGGMFFTPVINWPEVAILGTGRITDKPVVRNGEIAIGKMMALSLSFDHRIIDGATAQHAMNLIKKLLEDPQMFVMEV